MNKLSILFLIVFTGGLVAQRARAYSDLSDFVGTWEYTIKVPSQDNDIKGNMLIANEDDVPSVQFITDSGDEVQVEDVTFEDDQLIISFEYNYNNYSMKLKQNEADKLSGVIVTPQGQELDVIAKKEDDS